MRFGIVIISSGYICRDTDPDGDHKVIAWSIDRATTRAAKWNGNERGRYGLHHTPYKDNYGVFEFTRTICKKFKQNPDMRYIGKILDQ